MATFVDVVYRGLPIAERARLSALSTQRIFVEVPAPMPVGAPLELAIDGGVRLAVVVRALHEQVAALTEEPGAPGRPPGMELALRADATDEPGRATWAALVADAPVAEAPAAPRRTTQEVTPDDLEAAAVQARLSERAAAIEPGADVRRRTRELSSQELAAAAQAAETIAQPIRPARPTAPRVVAVSADGLVDDGRPTQIMEAIDSGVVTAAVAAAEAAPDGLVDDGRATQVMQAIPDEPSASGSLPVIGDDPSTTGSMPAVGSEKSGSTKVKKRKKR